MFYWEGQMWMSSLSNIRSWYMEIFSWSKKKQKCREIRCMTKQETIKSLVLLLNFNRKPFKVCRLEIVNDFLLSLGHISIGEHLPYPISIGVHSPLEPENYSLKFPTAKRRLLILPLVDHLIIVNMRPSNNIHSPLFRGWGPLIPQFWPLSSYNLTILIP